MVAIIQQYGLLSPIIQWNVTLLRSCFFSTFSFIAKHFLPYDSYTRTK